jgi:hypothetical protein
MSKYDLLGQYLKTQRASEVPMTFAEIERVVGTNLPPSAYRHRPWWSNNATNSVMTKVWLNAGYEASRVDIEARKLVFRRIAREAEGVSGMSDAAKEFVHANPAKKKFARHPAWGSMKGTFTIEPGYDLTSPIYSDEEWKEVERLMEEDWDQIEQGMKSWK